MPFDMTEIIRREFRYLWAVIPLRPPFTGVSIRSPQLKSLGLSTPTILPYDPSS